MYSSHFIYLYLLSIYRIRPSILPDDPVRSLCTGAKRMGGLFSWWKASQREAKTECKMIDLTDYRQTCSFPIIFCLAFESMPAFLVPQRLGFLSQAFFSHGKCLLQHCRGQAGSLAALSLWVSNCADGLIGPGLATFFGCLPRDMCSRLAGPPNKSMTSSQSIVVWKNFQHISARVWIEVPYRYSKIRMRRTFWYLFGILRCLLWLRHRRSSTFWRQVIRQRTNAEEVGSTHLWPSKVRRQSQIWTWPGPANACSYQ